MLGYPLAAPFAAVTDFAAMVSPLTFSGNIQTIRLDSL
jgi:hypothetical protein